MLPFPLTQLRRQRNDMNYKIQKGRVRQIVHYDPENLIEGGAPAVVFVITTARGRFDLDHRSATAAAPTLLPKDRRGGNQ